jgi:hypothetical protein
MLCYQCSATVHLVIIYSNVFNMNLQYECSVDGAWEAIYELKAVKKWVENVDRVENILTLISIYFIHFCLLRAEV